MKTIIEVDNGQIFFKNFHLGPIKTKLPEGVICGLVGRNGAGKTTFLKGVSGLPCFHEGEVIYKQKPVDFLDPEIRTKMTYISNDIQMYSDFSVKQAVEFVSKLHVKWDYTWFYYWLNVFQINQDVQIHQLSKGMKMKLNLLLGLGHQPDIVLLDEPTDGLDSIARKHFFDLLQGYMETEGRTIILSTHYTKDIEGICDYVLFMKNGQIEVEGEVDLLKENYRYFSLPPETDLEEMAGIVSFNKTDVEKKGVISKKHVSELPEHAIIKTPTLDDLFYYVVEKGAAE